MQLRDAGICTICDIARRTKGRANDTRRFFVYVFVTAFVCGSHLFMLSASASGEHRFTDTIRSALSFLPSFLPPVCAHVRQPDSCAPNKSPRSCTSARVCVCVRHPEDRFSLSPPSFSPSADGVPGVCAASWRRCGVFNLREKLTARSSLCDRGARLRGAFASERR